MRDAAHIAVRSMAKFVLPVMLLVGLYLSLIQGNGLAGGVMAALALGLHALVFGPAATSRLAPPLALRIVAAFGATALAASAAIDWILGAAPPHSASVGLFLITGAGGALVLLAISGRAHALRDEDW